MIIQVLVSIAVILRMKLDRRGFHKNILQRYTFDYKCQRPVRCGKKDLLIAVAVHHKFHINLKRMKGIDRFFIYEE